MIVVVTGTRELTHSTNRLRIKRDFFAEILRFAPDYVYHGGAFGPDSWAAIEFYDCARVFRPDPLSDRTPAQRLFDRNIEMINTAILNDPVVRMVACWDGKSKGTKHAMDYAQEMDVTITRVRIEDE